VLSETQLAIGEVKHAIESLDQKWLGLLTVGFWLLVASPIWMHLLVRFVRWAWATPIPLLP
jgi:hypothetical protein